MVLIPQIYRLEKWTFIVECAFYLSFWYRGKFIQLIISQKLKSISELELAYQQLNFTLVPVFNFWWSFACGHNLPCVLLVSPALFFPGLWDISHPEISSTWNISDRLPSSSSLFSLWLHLSPIFWWFPLIICLYIFFKKMLKDPTEQIT